MEHEHDPAEALWRILPIPNAGRNLFVLVNCGAREAVGVRLERRDGYTRPAMANLPAGVNISPGDGHKFHVSRALPGARYRPKYLFVTWDGHEMPVRVELPK